VRGSHTGRGKRFSLLQPIQIDCGSHSFACSVDTMVLSRWYSCRGVTTTHLQLVLRLRISGAVSLLPLYALTVTTTHLQLVLRLRINGAISLLPLYALTATITHLQLVLRLRISGAVSLLPLRLDSDNHSSPTSAKVTNKWSSNSVPSIRLDTADRAFTSVFQ
jgi:hypothetical protein